MKSKIIDFPNAYFKRKRDLALTPLMIDTLLAACAKQKEKIPFGPCDIKRSFTALVNRGLIIRENVYINEDTESLWQVSNEAIQILKTMGIESSLLTFTNEFRASETRSILINL